MVICHKTDVAVILWKLISREILVCKVLNIALAVWIKDTLIALIVTVTEKSAVTVAVVVKIEVHMETCVVYCSFGIAPFGYHCSLRIIFVEHFTDTTPDFCCCNLFIIVLYEWVCHINSETVCALIKPETHNVLDCLYCSKTVRMVARQLPLRMCDFVETVVESRLWTEIVY